jgi:hypothetical protein
MSDMGQTSGATKHGTPDELALLETERDRLQSMISYHNPPNSPRLVAASAIFIFGLAGLLVASIDSLSERILAVVILALAAYILAQRVTLFGISARLIEIVILSGSQIAGEPEIRQRLAKCEAEIVKLKDSRW